MKTKRTYVDVRVENHGSLYLLQPRSVAALRWFEQHIPLDAPYFGGALVVEPRYVGDILAGIREEGMVAQ